MPPPLDIVHHTADVRKCAHCKRRHDDLPVRKLDTPDPDDNHNFEADCPETKKPLPLWRSGFGADPPEE